MRHLPIATRAWTRLASGSETQLKVPPDPSIKNEKGKGKPGSLPDHALVIDTETTTDETQRFLFGVWRYLRRRTPTSRDGSEWECVAEGIIYADDLFDRDPDAFDLLADYAGSHLAEVSFTAGRAGDPDWQLGFLSRTEFAERWWHYLGVPQGRRDNPAVLVFFNAPFDISRLASGVSEARKDMAGGFSFQIMANADGTRRDYRPDVAVKSIDSKRALINNRAANERGKPKIPGYRGHYLDLRTAEFSLSGEAKTLAGACKSYGLSPKTHTELGSVTTEAVEYCRNDVKITAELFEAVVADYEAHGLDLQLTKVYSPASLAKSYLTKMGIRPLLDAAGADTPDRVLGAAMSAFYGGRAECHLRKTLAPVRLVDYTSMYPTVNALMGSWDLITCERIEILDNPEHTLAIQEFIDAVTAETMFDPTSWKRLLTLVEIIPDRDVLPVRAEYKPGEFSIGVNTLAHDQPHWYPLADVIGSKITTGKPPQILRAISFTPIGKTPGLQPVRLRGEVIVDPRDQDFFTLVIEQRAHTIAAFGKGHPLAKFLKVLANSGSYGIYAQLTATDGEATLDLWTGDDKPRAVGASVKRPEEPGPYFYAPLAASITGGARLMLALLEHKVTSLGGQGVFCDTDSMAIIATPHGGDLIQAPGGAHRTVDKRPAVKALSYAQVAEIRDEFNKLNPYNPAAVPNLLKDETDDLLKDHDGLDANSQVWCCAISAKRYALYTLDTDGQISILKASEHGLGQLIDPLDPDPTVEARGASGARVWIEDVWRAIITSHLKADDDGYPAELVLPAWADKPAHGRFTISSTALLRPFKRSNSGRPYADRIKPANFLVTATIDAEHRPDEKLRLIAPYSTHASSTTRWVNLYDPGVGPVTVTTDPSQAGPDVVVVKTYRQVINEYAHHPEAKFLDHTGEPCRRNSRGLLQRTHVGPTRWMIIGKEANRLDEVQDGLLTPEEATTVYDDGTMAYLHEVALPRLVHLSNRELARLVGCDPSTISRIRKGRHPKPDLMDALINAAELPQ